MRAIPIRFLLCVLSALALPAQADPKPGAFSARLLRGYGEVAAQVIQIDAKSSLLTIKCADETKARILEAKYLSDLGLLPGVSTKAVQTNKGALPARAVEGQGLIAAIRSGATVFILAAQDDAGLVAVCEKHLPAGAQLDFTDETEKDAGVPMYLDRWDRYGFRFYYAPLVPPGHISSAPEPVTYSPQTDLDFALNSGNAGLVLWESPFPIEQAEGILKTPLWSWIPLRAQETGMPLGINLSTGVPCSLYNRYREEWTMADPQYLGGFYGLLSADEGIFSWDSIAGRDAQMAELQQTVRRYNHVDNIVNWLNPDGEMGHGAPDNLINYGPVADAGYRQFLKAKYETPEAVSKRWYGHDGTLTSWKEVHVPELATFFGWGKEAIDLTGTWKRSTDAAVTPEAITAAAAPAFDDSSWASMTAPGDGIAMQLAHKSAVLRRHVSIDPKWRADHPGAWLYVFDLSDTRAKGRFPGTAGTQSFLNGAELSAVEPAQPTSQEHWAVYDVSSTLKAGDNVISISVPQGFFNYRVYISPLMPRNYPDLGPELNAQWADFIDWGSWSRGEAVKRGAQMIRQVDPNRPITFMSPDTYADDIKSVCEDYGGVFHNTGYMAGVWADFHCMEMNSADLPTDCEPGSGAKTLEEFKHFLGLWSTEGIQGIDYFQHIGDVEWNPEIKAYFGDTLKLWHLIGKYHTPKSQLALLSSDRVDRLYGFPFHKDLRDGLQRHGHWEVRFNELLMPEFPRDELFPHDFERGYADAYKVIIDSNTTVMDPELVDRIAKWVKAGGIFVTWGQTGRHTSVQKDAWPIAKLTGFSVADLDHGQKQVVVAPGQTMLPDNPMWPQGSMRGMSLQKDVPEGSDLLTWSDGKTAVGLRPLGKGYVIEVGPQMGTDRALKLFEAICDFAKIARIPATTTILMRHFVSNNGLYDVWAMCNTKKDPVNTTLTFKNGLDLKSAIDVKTGQPIALQVSADGPVMPVNLAPWTTQVVLTPRQSITTAPADWFALQRNWWRNGSGKGEEGLGAPMPEFKSKYTLDLQPGWTVKPLGTDAAQGATLADSKVDDSSWKKEPMGIFNIKPHDGELHFMARKTFTVPADWKSGPVTLWLTEWHGVGFLDKGQAYLDGQPISTKAILGDDLGGAFKAGSTHTLAIEIWGSNPVVGTPASVWLNYRPDAPEHQDLSGPWEAAADGLTYGAPVTIPGSCKGTALRRIVKIGDEHAGQTAVLRIDAKDAEVYGAIINGTWISRFHHHIGHDFDLAITPYLKFGQDNQIVLYGGAHHDLTNVSLEYYSKGTYP